MLYNVAPKGVRPAPAAQVAAVRATAGTGVNSFTGWATVACGAEGVRVNAIAPGTTLTRMMLDWEAESPGFIDRLNTHTPPCRAAEPEEVAEAAAWLLSDRASCVTGVALAVDGGIQAS